MVEITEKLLKDLQNAEEKYRTVFEHSRDAIILTDRKGRIIESNRAGVKMLGYKNQEELFSLTSFADLFVDRKDLTIFQERIFDKGYDIEFETRLRRREDQEFFALISSNLTYDKTGEFTGYVVILRDITRLEGIQQQLEIQNARLGTMNAVSMAVSRSLDLVEVLNYTIEKIVEIIKYDCLRIYLLDDKEDVLSLVAHRGLASKYAEMDYVKKQKVGDGLLGRTANTGKISLVDNFERSGGPYVDVLYKEGLQSTVYIPLISKVKTVGVMCMSSHSKLTFSPGYIEFLRAIGNQIGMAVDNANLYAHIKKAYQNLADAQEQIIQTERLASLGKLAATIAHEINNPLAAVLTYTKLLIKLMDRDRFTPEKLGDISQYLATMEMETSRCGDIVKNLLAFSRQSKITILDHRIEEIIDRALILISHDLEMKGIQLIKEIEPDLPEVRCDFKQIQQALLGIMINASEAMGKGGILTVRAKHSQKKGFLDVVVSDAGCGISKEDLNNIFEPFFTTKENVKGVGLGLSVAYGIITKHGGSIDVESEPGKGSSFTICLSTSDSQSEVSSN